jgi:predicted transcriptional regulator
MNLQFELQEQQQQQQVRQPQEEVQSRAVRRSKMEMLCDTLAVIASGETAPTRIMYHANMSWIETKRCLKLLIDRGLVQAKADQKRETYELTDKGYELVHTFNNIRQDLNIIPIH